MSALWAIDKHCLMVIGSLVARFWAGELILRSSRDSGTLMILFDVRLCNCVMEDCDFDLAKVITKRLKERTGFMAWFVGWVYNVEAPRAEGCQSPSPISISRQLDHLLAVHHEPHHHLDHSRSR